MMSYPAPISDTCEGLRGRGLFGEFQFVGRNDGVLFVIHIVHEAGFNFVRQVRVARYAFSAPTVEHTRIGYQTGSETNRAAFGTRQPAAGKLSDHHRDVVLAAALVSQR